MNTTNPQLDVTIDDLLEQTQVNEQLQDTLGPVMRPTIPNAVSITNKEATQMLRAVNLNGALRELQNLRSFNPTAYAVVLQFFADSAK